MEAKKRINILNIAAGQGEAAAKNPTEGENYYTTDVGDARRYTAERCASDPDVLWFCVYGGDGTVNEVVSGILDADAGDRTYVSVVPVGTGNDFVRSLTAAEDEAVSVDVITCNGHYAVNMINIGFDCNVVASTAKKKKLPLVKGTAAYILGVVDVLSHKMGQTMKITMTDEHDTEHVIEREVLLCAVANASFCGGGFCAAPSAKYDDGIVDLLIIRKVSRMKFVSLVGGYRAGTHILEDGSVSAKYRDIIDYYRCRKITIEGLERVCVDGEIEDCCEAEIGVLPRAVRFLQSPEN